MPEAHRVELLVIRGAEVRAPEKGGEGARRLLSLRVKAQRLRQLSRGCGELA